MVRPTQRPRRWWWKKGHSSTFTWERFQYGFWNHHDHNNREREREDHISASHDTLRRLNTPVFFSFSSKPYCLLGFLLCSLIDLLLDYSGHEGRNRRARLTTTGGPAVSVWGEPRGGSGGSFPGRRLIPASHRWNRRINGDGAS